MFRAPFQNPETSKVTRPTPLRSQKVYPVRPLRFLRTSHRKLSEAKQAEKTAKRRGLKVSPFVKSSGRAFVTVAILLLYSHMNRAENRTLLQAPFCGAGGCGRGDFEGELAELLSCSYSPERNPEHILQLRRIRLKKHLCFRTFSQ